MSHKPFIRRIRPYIQHRRIDQAGNFKYFPVWNPTTPWEKLTPAMDKDVHVPFKPHKIQNMFALGPEARLQLIGERVTKLVKFERIELNKVQALETRMYMEQLLIQAIRHGDRHRYTMECADFYLHEKGLIHKLFKVLVPRYANYTTAFTSIFFLAPKYEVATSEKVKWQIKVPARSEPYPAYTGRWAFSQRAVVELKGNPLPPLRIPPPKNANILTNVLLAAARQEAYHRSIHELEEDAAADEEVETQSHSNPESTAAEQLSESQVDPVGKPAEDRPQR